ncbi:hypothetical protein GQS_02965 [Thermococcus sp. 4557]|uniref:hypothetical protein n=1 Tax=Thermococcus sp. (strain CGMCC 1.5172 / 4557) TaxID=1042877 RepID=UPI000219EF30|nr:hypothetical protein [Thermococcus sp. 4557]AEK72494.1 hypothetical protein GQS_02965 [Thermococcus sp. 4557]
MPYFRNIASVNIQNAGEAHVFVSALYPEGFKQIAEYDVKNNGRLVLNLGNLRKAWEDEYRKNKRLSQPLILLTIVTKDGKVSIETISFNWDKMPQSKAVTPKFKALKNTVKTSSEQTNDVQPLYYYSRTLVDSYEWTAPTIVAQVTPDSSTKGYISYTYFINKKVGFSINAFVDTDWTRLASYNIIQKEESGKHASGFAEGSSYYIWMNVKYRYEKWRVYSAGWVWYEEYVYVKDFYPSTINGGTSKPSNAQVPPIDRWIDEGVHSSTGREPYYNYSMWNLDTSNFAVDALKFIDILELMGKISESAAQKATLIGLFIDVGFEYDNMKAFDFDLSLDSDIQATHHVWRGESTDMTTVPVLYFDVD